MAAKHGMRKALPQEVFEAIKRHDAGESVKDIAASLGFHPTAVSRWLSAKSHARVGSRIPATEVAP